jgi:hypothetical protein
MEEIDTIGREKIIAAHQRRLFNLNKEKEATEQYLEEQLEEITKDVVGGGGSSGDNVQR